MKMFCPVIRQMFSDRKQKAIVFPDVSAEDTVVWTIKRTHKPFFAGQFFTGAVFPRGVAFEDVRRKITLPKEMAVHLEARGVDHQVEEAALDHPSIRLLLLSFYGETKPNRHAMELRRPRCRKDSLLLSCLRYSRHQPQRRGECEPPGSDEGPANRKRRRA